MTEIGTLLNPIDTSSASDTAERTTFPPRRVAVVVIHGMGQQIPFETLDSVAMALLAAANRSGAAAVNSDIKHVRLGDLEVPPGRVELPYGQWNHCGTLSTKHIGDPSPRGRNRTMRANSF